MIAKLDFIKVKNFCSDRYCEGNQRTGQRLGNIFGKVISDKGLLHKISKHFSNSKKRKWKKPH